MTAIPGPQKPDLIRLIDLSHEQRAEPPRYHMGCSQLGHHCDRWLWLSFRWAIVEQFSGRMLRLFRRGQNEEATVVADLRAAGLHITSTGSDQARVDFGNHVSGSIDGIIEHGVPEAPNKKHILEIKTHSQKSFDDLCKNAVKKSKPVHWVQMQVYMLGKGIDRALYVAVNKNDDALYIERVRLDKTVAEAYVVRGHSIVSRSRMPEPCVNAGPDWYQCKYCPAYSFCHGAEAVKQVSCRTCTHSTPEQDGAWSCARWGAEIPKEHQRNGCDSHVMHPDMVPEWRIDESQSTETVAAWVIDGHTVKNGDPVEGEHIYTTREIVANLEMAKLSDPVIDDLRGSFGGRITG